MEGQHLENLENAIENSIRYQTLPLEDIDRQKVAAKVCDDFRRAQDDRGDFLEKREEWSAGWRDLNVPGPEGPWENSSNFHVPLQLTLGKAIHARLWQLFSQDFFGVLARKEVFEGKVPAIKSFMKFILEDYANKKTGTRDTWDETLWDTVFEGSGYCKVGWDIEVNKYLEVVPVVEVEETVTFSPDSLTGVVSSETKMKEREEIREEIIQTPFVQRISLEDLVMPAGSRDPQTALFVAHRIYMTSEELKAKVTDKGFSREAVERVIKHKSSLSQSIDTQIKQQRFEQEGIYDTDGYFNDFHVVIEYYGKGYVKKRLDGNEEYELSDHAEELVYWVHQATGELLGWTYLYRVSPSGIRPIFKFDFIKFPGRTHGVGVGEVLDSTSRALDGIYNLRQDNGVLASTPMGFYRASSGLKADRYRVAPGEFIPVDDPQNDVRVIQLPFLQGFGYQEEAALTSYAERALPISELTLGQAPKGVFRTASGASAYEAATAVQLEIHFDRFARTMSKLLQCLFRLCRERMPSEIFFRVTGENGQPIFGRVNRDDLRAEVDFEINIDVLSQSRIEAQQQATLIMQTLMNPSLMQMGIVTPGNMYEVTRNFLMKNRVRKIDNYITKPQGYTQEPLTAQERLFRIIVDMFTVPPVEDTVRMEEDHQQALSVYEIFENSPEFGLLNSPEKIGAYQRLKDRHMQMMQAMQQAPMPNRSGTQMPLEGVESIQAMETGAANPGEMPSQGTLGAPMGGVNGPVF